MHVCVSIVHSVAIEVKNLYVEQQCRLSECVCPLAGTPSVRCQLCSVCGVHCMLKYCLELMYIHVHVRPQVASGPQLYTMYILLRIILTPPLLWVEGSVLS